MTSEQCEAILVEIRETKAILKDILDYSKPHWEVKPESPKKDSVEPPKKRVYKKSV